MPSRRVTSRAGRRFDRRSLRRKFSASEFIADVRRYNARTSTPSAARSRTCSRTPGIRRREQPAEVRLRPESSPARRDRVRRRGSACYLVGGYGSSEGAIIITRRSGDANRALGEPSDGQDVAVVDTERRTSAAIADFDDDTAAAATPMPPSARSCAATPASSFEGYYNNPEATAERNRNGWYWSGDLGYRDADGIFYFAGRTADWLRVDGENFAAGADRTHPRPPPRRRRSRGLRSPRPGDRRPGDGRARAAIRAAVRRRRLRARSSPSRPTSAPSGRRGSCGSSTRSR